MKTLLICLFFSFSALSHHSFSVEYDDANPIDLEGEITSIEWINPHTFIHIKVTNHSEKNWAIEGGTPNSLMRKGLTKDTIKVGTEIIVRGYQSKDKVCNPECKASGRDITLQNGKKLFQKVSK